MEPMILARMQLSVQAVSIWTNQGKQSTLPIREGSLPFPRLSCCRQKSVHEELPHNNRDKLAIPTTKATILPF